MTNLQLKITGCVILYHPQMDVIDNILSYIDYVECLYIVDNGGGEAITAKFVDNPKVKLICHKENMGIAYSLNEVLKSVANEYDLLLTMDQDSSFVADSMKKYVDACDKIAWNTTLALGAKIVAVGTDIDIVDNVEWIKAENMITSGNLISVKNALAIGGFDEELFIDEVDSDFIYRGRENGLDILYNKCGIYLAHTVGSPEYHSFLRHVTKVQNHNKIRKYYMFRNRLVVLQKHFKIIGFRRAWNYYIKANISLLRDTLFFEDDTFGKLQYMMMGFMDFLCGRLGKRF